MSTSGTYTFMMTADSVITAALRSTGRFGAADAIPADDKANCQQALNIIIKNLARNQKPLWCKQRVAIPLLAAQATYNLSTAAGMTLPPRILFAFIRDSVGNDTTLSITSRDDYNTLGQKSAPGVPNQIWYDPQLSGGIITVYNVPSDGTHTMYVDIQRQMQDINLLTDDLDIPQEGYHLLKWMLCDELAPEYLVPMDARQDITRRAKAAYEDFFADEREETSTYFTPSERKM